MVGIKFKLEKNWHTYWENPGDAGEGASIEWNLPRGVKASPILWPGPERIPVDPLMTFGYNDEVVLLTKISTDGNLVFPLNIKAQVGWFTCKDICIPQEGNVDILIEEGSFYSSDHQKEIQLYSEKVPDKFSQKYRVEKLDNKYFLQTDIDDGEHFNEVYFFPKEYGLTDYSDCLLYTSPSPRD